MSVKNTIAPSRVKISRSPSTTQRRDPGIDDPVWCGQGRTGREAGHPLMNRATHACVPPSAEGGCTRGTHRGKDQDDLYCPAPGFSICRIKSNTVHVPYQGQNSSCRCPLIPHHIRVRTYLPKRAGGMKPRRMRGPSSGMPALKKWGVPLQVEAECSPEGSDDAGTGREVRCHQPSARDRHPVPASTTQGIILLLYIGYVWIMYRSGDGKMTGDTEKEQRS